MGNVAAILLVAAASLTTIAIACSTGGNPPSPVALTPTVDPAIRVLTTTAVARQQELDRNQTVTSVAIQRMRERDLTLTAIALAQLRSRNRTATAVAMEQRRFDHNTATAITRLTQNRTATARAVVLRRRQNATSTSEAVERARARVITSTAFAEERQLSEQATATAFAQRLQQTRDQTATALALLPTSTPTATPVRDPSGIGREKLVELRQIALDLINQSRRDAGLVELVLDDNPTAQIHANNSRRDCLNGPWGTNGLNLAMLYTLNGGTDNPLLLTRGADYCPDDPSEYIDRSFEERVVRGHERTSDVLPGRTSLVFGPSHRKVGIGFSYTPPNFWIVQVFSPDYIVYEQLPKIEGTKLSFAYTLRNGATQSSSSVAAFIHYDRPTHPLTRGQLARTSCFGFGQRIAGLRAHAPFGQVWAVHSFQPMVNTCVNPYDVPRFAAAPTSYEAASELYQEALSIYLMPPSHVVNAPYIPAEVSPLDPNGLQVEADISDLLAQYGPGVYGVLIIANIDGEDAPISHYSIFVD